MSGFKESDQFIRTGPFADRLWRNRQTGFCCSAFSPPRAEPFTLIHIFEIGSILCHPATGTDRMYLGFISIKRSGLLVTLC